MPIQPFQPHYPFTDDKLAQLRQIVPEAFEDGRLNFDTLKEVLQPNLDPEGVVEDDSDRFGLQWPGKKEARRLAAIPSKGTLAPVYGQGLKADGTPDDDGHNDSRNVFIEGENLEVLKIMQKAYAGRVKMIYIDPPYNTGNDFVYDDNFTEPLEHYLRRTGQIDDEGQKLTTNTKADGRFHSKWLSMMYPRLRLARNLLREDGVIFVSIDDNEVHNLRQLMNEVFGEENFVGQFNWQKTTTPSNLSKRLKRSIEYVFAYSKQAYEIELLGVKKNSKSSNGLMNQANEASTLRFTPEFTLCRLPDGTYPAGRYGTDKYDIELLDDVRVEGAVFQNSFRLYGRFKWSQEYLDQSIEDGVTVQIASDKFSPSYIKEDYGAEKPWNILNKKSGVHTNENASSDLENLFEGNQVFSNPKPVSLIKYFINSVSCVEDDIVLDFFAGSGTTAQATLDSKLRFVIVQVPQTISTKGLSGAAKQIAENAMKYLDSVSRPRTISEISQERVIRAMKKEKMSGFRVFALDKKQIEQVIIKSLQNQFNAIEKQYNPQFLLWEVALNEGFPLDSRVEVREVAGQTVSTLTSEFHDFALHCCFDPSIAPAAAPEIPLGENDVLVCLDRALDDQTKLRLSDRGMLKTI